MIIHLLINIVFKILINDSQENEINKILQDGIDKSLLFINSLNIRSFNEFSSSAKNLTNKYKSDKYIKTSNFNTQKIGYKIPHKTSNLSKNSKIKFKPFSKSQISLRPNSASKLIKKKKKLNAFDYQVEYNKKTEELEKCKNELIQERIKQNKLKNDIGTKSKKEKEFKKLEEDNNLIEKNSEDLILKIQQNERIREEQTKIIDRLLEEYNCLIKELRRNPNVEVINKYDELKLEADSLRQEKSKKINNKLKKKVNKK